MEEQLGALGLTIDERSIEVKELFSALGKAQGEMGSASKDKDNPFFRSKYADLNSCFEACRKALVENGFAVIQIPGGNGEVVTVKTILAHSSGQFISGVLAMKPVKNDPQGVGSVITYARRYGLVSMVGLSQEDDDGNSASTPQAVQKPQAVKPKVKTLSDSITEEANKRFKSWDEFKAWRIENALSEKKVEDMSELERAKVLTKLRENHVAV